MITLNLPLQPTPFIGRGHELAEISRILRDPACQLLTLVGPGGIGKTRLAIHVAEQFCPSFADGTYFVSLVSLTDVQSIVPAISSAIGLPFCPNVEMKEQLLECLGTRQILLVMDNFEHLLAGANLMNDLLQVAPAVRILVTSRERLNVQRETVFHVPGLNYPDQETSTDAVQYDAVQLLLGSLHRLQPEFTVTAETMAPITRICRQVQGMPLAIVLAAAWADTLSLQEISEEITRGFDFLETAAQDVPVRHRNIRAVFDPSWEMMSEEERSAYTRLSVFRGSFTREAAQAVTGASLHVLGMLVNKSMVQHSPAGRYDIHRLLRQYAEDKLNSTSQERETAHDLYCAYYADFMHRQWERSKTGQQKAALAEVAGEYENLVAAWLYMVHNGKATSIRKFIHMWFLLFFVGLRPALQEGLPLTLEAERELRRYDAGAETQLALGLLLTYLARGYVAGGLPDKGQELAQEGLALLRSGDDREDIMIGLLNLSITAWFAGHVQEARNAAEEGFAIAGDRRDLWGMSYLMYWVGTTMATMKDYAEAKHAGEECLRLVEQSGDLWLQGCLHAQLFADIEMALLDYAEAKSECLLGLPYFETLGESWAIAATYRRLGDIAAEDNNNRQAVEYYLHSMRLLAAIGFGWETPNALLGICKVLASGGQLTRAVELLELILQYPATLKMTRQDAELLLVRFQAQLTPEAFEAARERGKRLAFDRVVAQLLGDGELEPLREGSVQGVDGLLSERELEVLRLIATGLYNQEIAQQLHLSVGTVKVHVRHLYDKLNVHNRTQAVAEARQLGLL